MYVIPSTSSRYLYRMPPPPKREHRYLHNEYIIEREEEKRVSRYFVPFLGAGQRTIYRKIG